MVSILDIIIIIFLSGFVFYGFFFGFIRTVGSLAGFIAGIWAASHFYQNFYDWIQNIFLGHPVIGKVISFFILFTIIKTLISFLFSILDKTFNFISIIPFLKFFNRALGAILGFFEGSMILGILILLGGHYQIFNNLINKITISSKITPFIIKTANLIVPLIPELLSKAKGISPF